MAASEIQSNLNMVMCVVIIQATVQLFNPFSRKKSSINRERLVSDGKMAKGHGSHSVFGVPYEVDPSSSDVPINNKDDRLAIHTHLRDGMSFFNT